MSGIRTSVEVVDRVSGSLNRITAALYNTTSAFGAVDRASDIAFNPSGVAAMTQEMYGYETRIQQLESDLVGANRRLEEMEEQTRKTAQASDTLKTAFKGVVGVLSAIGVGKIIETSDELMQTTSRLNMMNDGLQTTQELVNMVYQSAQNSRGSFSEMADVVARFGNNAKDAFSSSEEVVAFAELVQKQMTVAGASTTEASNAMLQLSQGLGSGVLRGDELNSIFEQAPNLIQNIADYLDVPIGTIREMASEGQITADIVKAAIFSASDDINAKFNEMPMTWGQIWQSMQNTALIKFQPVLQRLNNIANSDKFQNLVNSATNAMTTVANVAVTIFDVISSIATFAYDNWSFLAPVIGAVLGIMGTYWAVTEGVTIAQTVLKGVMGAFSAIQTFLSIGWGVLTGNTAAASAAQFVYNSALLACPITWIIMAIIALIAIIYLVVAAVNKFTDSSVSATGIIFGAFAFLGAAIWNIIVGVINGIIQFLWTYFVEPWIGIIEFVLNVMNGGFNSFGDAVKNLLGNIISWFLSLGKVVTKIIDAIFGTNWTSGLNSLQDKVLSWGKNENAITLDRTAPDIGGARIEYGDAWNAGYSLGEGLESKVSGMFGGSSSDASLGMDSAYTDTGAGSLLDGVNNIASDTSAISDSVDISNENLKYLRDLSERDVINRFTTAEIKVDMTNNNNIASGTDLDGIITSLSDGLLEAMAVTAEGVH